MKVDNKKVFAFTLKQFEILNDVLWEIEESRTYEGEDNEALQELKHMFNYGKFKEFRSEIGGNDEN